MTRVFVLAVIASTLAACISPPANQSQADTVEKRDCMQQAKDYMQRNMTTIPNEWRQHEQYKQYQKCVWEKEKAQQNQ